MRTEKFLGLAISFLACSVLFSGCSGDTSGKAADDRGDQFVATDASAGSISIDVNNPELPVADVSGFRVTVLDANGAAVPGVTVACDSELGVAILEPTTGREITDSYGTVSGKLGCKYPGSFQFACRLPMLSNKRKLVRIKCTGDTPAGFDGFPNSAGGGLGTGGVDTGGLGGLDPANVRITRIIGETVAGDSYNIDTVRGTCGTAEAPTAEPFSNDSISITISNNTNSRVSFTRMQYEVPRGDTGGRKFVSDSIAFICDVPGSGGTATCSSLFVQADSATGTKMFYDSSNSITYKGFASVTFTLTGTMEATGETIEVTSRTGFSFENFNNCETTG